MERRPHSVTNTPARIHGQLLRTLTSPTLLTLLPLPERSPGLHTEETPWQVERSAAYGHPPELEPDLFGVCLIATPPGSYTSDWPYHTGVVVFCGVLLVLSGSESVAIQSLPFHAAQPLADNLQSLPTHYSSASPSSLQVPDLVGATPSQNPRLRIRSDDCWVAYNTRPGVHKRGHE